MVSSILPKNECWDNFRYIKLSQCSFFGRIEDTINCFRDLLTFSESAGVEGGRNPFGRLLGIWLGVCWGLCGCFGSAAGIMAEGGGKFGSFLGNLRIHYWAHFGVHFRVRWIGSRGVNKGGVLPPPDFVRI